MTTTSDSQPVCPKCGAAIPAEAPQGLCPKCFLSEAATFLEEPADPGEAVSAPSLERVGRAFPNLEIIELIGQGGMSFVFKARQPHLDRFVALKLLPDRLAQDPRFAERFNREARVLAKLNHPNIVSVFDFGRAGEFYFLMMEFVDGVNLRQAMRAGAFSPQEALNVVPRICEALQYAHDQGVLHRDIKPENILLDVKGRVMIADFGIAKIVGEDLGPQVTLTNTGSALGTPHYMAPEQLEHPSEVDHRADIYSLGVVFYEMLTGELPIGRFDAPSSKTPVAKGVDDAVLRALERNRDRRQGSAREFQTQVETSGTGPAAAEGSPGPGGTRYSRPAIFGAALVGFSLLAIVAGAMAVRAAGGGLGVLELLIVGLPVLLCALGGTILGWVGLSEIHRSAGARVGLPLALFAAVAYPFGVPALTVAVLPAVTLVDSGQGLAWPGRIVVFILIAGCLSALLWAVIAIARWAGNRPGRHWSSRGWAATTAALTLGMILLAGLSGPSGRLTNRPASPSPQFSASERLPSGVAELLAVGRHPADGQWWKPDGTPWIEAPFENPGHEMSPQPGQRAVEMVLRIAESVPATAGAEFLVDDSPGWSSGNRVLRDGQEVSGARFLTALFPRERSVATVRVGIADGPWETLMDEPHPSQVSTSLVRQGQPLHIEFLEAVENSDGGTVLTVAHDVAGQQVRLVAVDADGKEIPSLLANQTRTHLTATFAQTPLARIERFRFQTRPYRWAVFEEVALEPRAGQASAAALTLPGVRLEFRNVNLREESGHDRLELQFTREDADAQIAWRSGGKFAGAPVDMQGDTTVNEDTGGDPVIKETLSLLLPDDLSREDKFQLLRQVRERWQGNSLVVQPGAEHEVLTVQQPGGNEVTIEVIGQPPSGRRP